MSSDIPLYENYDEATQRSTEVFTDGETGLPVIVQSQNTKPIVESAKAIASSYDPLVRRDVTHVARIPLVIWQRLMRLGIAKDPKAMNAWLDSREARLFRTDNARRL
jgi:hypothetical protein